MTHERQHQPEEDGDDGDIILHDTPLSRILRNINLARDLRNDISPLYGLLCGEKCRFSGAQREQLPNDNTQNGRDLSQQNNGAS